MHEGTDPEVFTVEQTIVGTLTTDGRTFRLPGVLCCAPATAGSSVTVAAALGTGSA